MVTNSRLIWSMSRDRRLPGYQLWRQVPKATGGPSWATALIAVIGVAITLVLRTHTPVLVTLFTVSMIMPALLCASMVLLYVFAGRRRRVQVGYFSLGRWEIPVIAGALVWLAYELIILTGSSNFRDVQYYTLGALGLGLVFYLGHWLLQPAVMRTKADAHGAEPFEAAGQPGPAPPPGTAGGGGGLERLNILAIDQNTSATRGQAAERCKPQDEVHAAASHRQIRLVSNVVSFAWVSGCPPKPIRHGQPGHGRW
jgi:hypothetical protein